MHDRPKPWGVRRVFLSHTSDTAESPEGSFLRGGGRGRRNPGRDDWPRPKPPSARFSTPGGEYSATTTPPPSPPATNSPARRPSRAAGPRPWAPSARFSTPGGEYSATTTPPPWPPATNSPARRPTRDTGPRPKPPSARSSTPGGEYSATTTPPPSPPATNSPARRPSRAAGPRPWAPSARSWTPGGECSATTTPIRSPSRGGLSVTHGTCQGVNRRLRRAAYASRHPWPTSRPARSAGCPPARPRHHDEPQGSSSGLQRCRPAVCTPHELSEGGRAGPRPGPASAGLTGRSRTQPRSSRPLVAPDHTAPARRRLRGAARDAPRAGPP
jgi:hypothetical protein